MKKRIPKDCITGVNDSLIVEFVSYRSAVSNDDCPCRNLLVLEEAMYY